MRKRLLALLAALILIISAVPVFATGSNAVTKKETTRAIAIVYDNSGSMFASNTPQAWCQATYAVEVFAAMMNKGDKLLIYPMNPVRTDGGKYSTNPIELTGGGDLSKIRNIESERDADTPVETIDYAYQGLQKASADEKWLIILTDGKTFYENGAEKNEQDTKTMLEGRIAECVKKVNVLYLGIGTGIKKPEVSSERYYADVASDGSQITYKLSEMCNKIFGRDELDKSHFSGKSVNFDVSMSKLIVFIQGEGIGGVTLKDSSGKEVGKKESSFTTRYNDKGNAELSNWKTDKTLQGELVTYSDCSGGGYTLSYKGNATSAEIYYEPDVDLVAKLCRNGEAGSSEIKGTDTLYPGNYTVSLEMVDFVTGQAVTGSDLLKGPSFRIECTVNGNKIKSDKPELDFSLRTGDTLEKCDLHVTYLKNYRIDKTGADFGWPDSWGEVPPLPHDVTVSCSGCEPEYNLSEFADKAYCTVAFSVDGEQLTAAQLGSVEPKFSIDGVKLDSEITDSGYLLKFGHLGEIAETECRDYTLTVDGIYTDQNGDTSPVSNPQNITFSIINDGFGLNMTVDAPQDYYQISKMDSSKPITVYLSKDDGKLTPEEFATVKLDIDADGLEYELEPDAENSAYIMRLKKSDGIEKGKHTIKFRATMTSNIGTELSSDGKTKIEIDVLPKWVKYAIASACIILVAAFIWFWMTRKVLPRKIVIDTGEPSVCRFKGRQVADMRFSDSSKNKNHRTVKCSIGQNTHGISDGFSLEIAAVSPRYVKSAKRKALVKAARFTTSNGKTMTVGTETLARERNSQRAMNDSEETDLNFTISSGETCELVTAYDKRAVRCEFTLKFK